MFYQNMTFLLKIVIKSLSPPLQKWDKLLNSVRVQCTLYCMPGGKQTFTVYPFMQTTVLYSRTLYHVYPITNTCLIM